MRTPAPGIVLLRVCLVISCGTCPAWAQGPERFDALDVNALPERLGLGRTPTETEIRLLDIDVSPDGIGLPPGRGTALEGAPIYAAQCAACHGARGEGVPQLGDRLVGRDPGDPNVVFDRPIGSFMPYATTLFDYVRRAMPFDRPGSLSDPEVYAVTAYLLYLNEIIADDTVMDAETLARVQMPARDRFVRDERGQ